MKVPVPVMVVRLEQQVVFVQVVLWMAPADAKVLVPVMAVRMEQQVVYVTVVGIGSQRLVHVEGLVGIDVVVIVTEVEHEMQLVFDQVVVEGPAGNPKRVDVPLMVVRLEQQVVYVIVFG